MIEAHSVWKETTVYNVQSCNNTLCQTIKDNDNLKSLN